MQIPHHTLGPQRTLFRAMLLRALLVTLLSVVGISWVVHQAIIAPQARQELDNAANLAVQELRLRLESKQDSAVSMAAALARDERVRQALLTGDRAPAVAAVKGIREDYAFTTAYQSISAQVIDANRIIRARSWDLNFFGEKAPHPLGAVVLEKNKAMARFGFGNAGTGIIAFAPVVADQQTIGLVSITQGVLSVVSDLQAKGIDWVMVVDEQGLAARNNNQLPGTYKNAQVIQPGHLLSHPTWFDASAVSWTRDHWAQLLSAHAPLQIEDRIAVVVPVKDEMLALVGRHILMIDAAPVVESIQTTQRYLLWVNLGIATLLVLMTGVLLWDVQHRVVRPLQGMATAIRRAMDMGQFEPSTAAPRPDEIGELQQSVNALFHRLSQALKEANRAVSQVAKGKFHTTMRGQYVGDLATLQAGINAAIHDLQNTHDSLVQANKAKGMFLANMSHESRTPMHAVIGMAYLALKTDLTDEQREYVTRIHTAANSLLGIINDILDFSKIEAGKLSLESVPFRLEDVVSNSLVMVRQAALDRNLELLLDMRSRDLLHSGGAFLGDPLRLGQVLTNLLSNAVKFTESGTVRLTAEITSPPGMVPVVLMLTVEDTGIGMTPDQVDRLFQEFTQADGSTTRKFGGTGLGLTITKRLLELMHGTVAIQSTQGQGTRFTVEVPLPPASKLHLPPVTQPPAHTRVLVIDDNDMARQVLANMLTNLGVQVTPVASAAQGLQLLRSGERFAHCFVDWVMPDMDGEAFLRAVAQEKIDGHLHHAPNLVVVSAHDTDTLMQVAAPLGVTRVLTKPVLPEHLRGMLRAASKGAANPIAGTPGETVPAASARLQGLRVLMAEDNRVNQILACKLMEAQGATVEVVNDGQQAVNRLQAVGARHFHVVLMDLQMPVMDGYTATQRLRADPQFDALPIVALTAHAMVEEVERCAALGMNDHVTKPINPEKLYATLAKHLPPGTPA